MHRSRRFLAAATLAFLLAACSGEGTGPGGSGPWTQVAAGDQFTCALTTEGRAFCWGSGIFGQLGNNATMPQGRPVAVAGDHVFRTLAVGSDHVCAIAADGELWCWGLNDFSELGTSTSACNNQFQFASCARAPVRVATAPAFDSIVVAGYASCGLTAAGAAHCWGWSDHGQTGNIDVGDIVDTPTPVSGGRVFSSLSLDIYHVCGTTSTALFCWGSNAYGQLGTDSVATPRCGSGAGFLCAPSPTASAAGLAVHRVAAGSSHTCVVTLADGAWCWGSNQYGALGNPNVLGGPVPAPVQGGGAFTRIDAGYDHTCALDDAGAAWCWGLNDHGQLGVLTVAEACPAFGSAAPCRTMPGLVDTPLRFDAISAGSAHACGLASDHQIWCWGRGTAGQLGDGRSVSSNLPVLVGQP